MKERKQKKTTSPNINGVVQDLLKDDIYIDAREELHKKGIYYITGIIDDDDLLGVQQDILLKHVMGHMDEIQLMINSVGGMMPETWALVDLVAHINMDTRTVGLGDCSSAGAILLACGTPGKRLITPNASIMIHCPMYLNMGGNVHQVAPQTKELHDEQEKHIRFWLEHSEYTRRQDVEKYLLGPNDRVFTAEEALDLGIVDGIVGQEIEKPAPKRKSTRKKS